MKITIGVWDIPVLAMGFRKLLAEEPDICCEWITTENPLTALRRHPVRILLVGHEASDHLLSQISDITQNRGAPAVILTTIFPIHADEVYHLWHGGIKGFVRVPKTTEDQTVVSTAIRAVATGSCFCDPAIANPNAVMPTSEPCIPTSRETEIMLLIAQGKSSCEMADILNLSTKTVETHRNNMMRKLGFHSVADVIRYVLTPTQARPS